MGICPWSPLAKGYLTKPAKAEGTSQRAILDGGIGRMTAGGEDASLQINSAYVTSSHVTHFTLLTVPFVQYRENRQGTRQDHGTDRYRLVMRDHDCSGVRNVQNRVSVGAGGS